MYVHIILSLLSSYPSLSHLTLPLPSHLVPTPAPGSSKTVPTAVSQPPTSCWRRRSCTAGCSEPSSSLTTLSTRSYEGSSLSLTTGSSTTMGCHQGKGAHVTGRYVDVLCIRVAVMARTGVAAPPTHTSHMCTYHHTVRMHLNFRGAKLCCIFCGWKTICEYFEQVLQTVKMDSPLLCCCLCIEWYVSTNTDDTLLDIS